MEIQQPVPSITLQAFATRELENDVLSIFFTASESGAEPNAVQEALRKKLAEAMAIVKPLLKEGEVEVETSGFSVSPRYDKKSVITGYYGTTALTVKGTDTATISGLASTVKTMVVAGTGNSLSKKARKAVEKELIAEAIASFREKADDAIKAFGIASYQIGEVTVGVDRDYGGRRGGGMRVMAAAAMESTPMEHEGGKTEVNANVSGFVMFDSGYLTR